MKDMGTMGRIWHLYKMGGITPAVLSVIDPQNAQQMAFIRSVMKEQRQTRLFAVPLAELETVVFDLETTGFSTYHGDEIISVGAVKTKGAGFGGTGPSRSETFYSIVNPRQKIPETVARLTGITEEMAANAPDLITVLHRFLQFTDKSVLVCHGSGHDKQFLNSALWKTCRVHLSHRVVDCMVVARWLAPDNGPYDLDTLLAKYGIPVTTRHHALEDAMMTARLWGKFITELERKNVFTFGDLYERLSSL